MTAAIAPAAEGTMMKAAYVNAWCAVGTVADTISFGEVAAPAAPQKTEVLVGVKAASICDLFTPLANGRSARATASPSARWCASGSAVPAS